MTHLTIRRLLLSIKWAARTRIGLPFETARDRARHALRVASMRTRVKVSSFCERHLTLILLALTLSNIYLLVTK
jgi:hypothetical protein